MALPEIRIRATAETAQAKSGVDGLGRSLGGLEARADEAARSTRGAAGASDELGRSATRASGNVVVLADRMNRLNRAQGGFGRSFTNLGYQINDFTVQVAAGTAASMALSQQLPQVLQGLGALGVVLGIAASLIIPVSAGFRAMAENGRDVTEVFGTLAPLVTAIGEGFRTVGAVAVQFAEAIINNLDRIIITAGVAAAFFGGRWVASFVAARIATFTLVGALSALRVALIRLGFTALIVGAGELVYQFSRLVKGAGTFGEALGLLKDVAVEVWERISLGAEGMVQTMKALWLDMKASFINAIADMASAAADMLFSIGQGMSKIPGMGAFGGSLMGVSNDMLGAITRGGGLYDQASDATSGAAGARGAAAGAFGAAGAPLESVQKIRDLLQGIKDDRITLPDLLGVGSEDGEGGAGGGGKTAAEKLDEQLTAQEDRVKAHMDRLTALTQGGLSEKLGAWGSYFDNLVALTGTKNERLLAIGKAFGAAQALIDAWQAHNAVLAAPGLPWWMRIASAAQVLAAGVGAVKAIQSVSSSGAGGGAASAGGASTATSAPARGPDTVINLVGDTFSRNGVRDLINQINEANEDGGRLRLA